MWQIFRMSFFGLLLVGTRAWATSELPEVVVAQGNALRVRSQPHFEGRVKGHFALGDQAFVLQRTSTTDTIDGRSDSWLLLLSTSGRFGWTFGGYWGTIEREWKEPFPPQDLMQWNFSPFHSQLSDVGKEWATAHFCKSILESPGRWNAFAFAGLSALQSSARYSRDLFLETLKTGIDIPFYSEEGEPARYQTFSIVAVLEAFWPANTNWVSLLTKPPEDPTPNWKWHVLLPLLYFMEAGTANPDPTFLKEAALEAPASFIFELKAINFTEDTRLRDELIVHLLKEGTVEQRRAAISFFNGDAYKLNPNTAPEKFILHALEHAQSDPDEHVRSTALHALVLNSNPPWTNAKKYLEKGLKDPSVRIRVECLTIIARWDTPLEIVPLVVERLDDVNSEVAVSAVSALGAGPEDSRYWEPLMKLLWPQGAMPQKKRRAAQVLSVERFRKHAASVFQKTVLEGDPILSAQSAAALCQPELLENQLPTLLTVLSRGTPEARAVVRQGLRSSRDPQARQALVLENQRYAIEKWEEGKGLLKSISGVSPAVTFNKDNTLRFVVPSSEKTVVTIIAPSLWSLNEGGALEWVGGDSRDVSQYLFRRKSEIPGQIVLECRVANLRVEGAFVFQRPGLYEITLTDTSGVSGVFLFFEPEPSLQFGAAIQAP